MQLHAAVAVAPAGRVHIADFPRLFLIGIGNVYAVFAVIGAHSDLRGALRPFLNDVIIVIHALPVARIVRTEHGAFQPPDTAVSGFVEHAVDLEPLVGRGELAVRTPVLKGVLGRSLARVFRIGTRRKRRKRTGKGERKTKYRNSSEFHIVPLLYLPRMRISEIPAMLCPSGFSTVMLTLVMFSSSANSAKANAPTFT